MNVVDARITLGSDGHVGCTMNVGSVNTKDMMELTEMFLSEINAVMSSLMGLGHVYRESVARKAANESGCDNNKPIAPSRKQSHKLTTEQKQAIRQLYANGVRVDVLARKYDVTRGAIRYLVKSDKR